MTTPIPWLDAADVARRLSVDAAADAIEQALLDRDLSADPPRVAVPISGGQLLLMPSAVDGAGVKVLTVNEANVPRIQGVYLLLDAHSLAPAALIDGPALTSLRTPAVSLVAVRRLARPDAARLVVFGAGPQAIGHALAITAARPITDVIVVFLSAEAGAAAVAQLVEAGAPARIGDAGEVAGADVVVCATTSAQPLFDGALLPDHACVVAIGSHEPDKRELDAALLGHAVVVVEDVPTALREAGDVVQAVRERALSPETLVPLGELVAGRELPDDRPRVFKSVGMAWQDLVIARRLTAAT